MHTLNLSTLEAESPWVSGQSNLQSMFQDSQGYTEKLHLDSGSGDTCL